MSTEITPRDAAILECTRTELALEAALEYTRSLRKMLETGTVEVPVPLHKREEHKRAEPTDDAPEPVNVPSGRPTADAPEIDGKRRRSCERCKTKQYGIKAGVCPVCKAIDSGKALKGAE